MATDPLLAQAATLLILLAIMQPFENICSVCGGILRGMKDTRIPMLISLFGYWGIAFPLMLLLVFVLRLDAIGIWIGLLAGLALVTGATFNRLWRVLGEHVSVTAIPEGAEPACCMKADR